MMMIYIIFIDFKSACNTIKMGKMITGLEIQKVSNKTRIWHYLARRDMYTHGLNSMYSKLLEQSRDMN